MDDRERAELIDYLIRCHVPDLRRVKLAAISVSPVGLSREERKLISDKASAYRAELTAKSSKDLRALAESEKENERCEAIAKAEAEETSRFSTRPEANADFEHWSKAAYWTLEEAVALVLGKDPHRVTSARLQPLTSKSPFAMKYSRTLDLALRAKGANQLTDPVQPGRFLEWAKAIQLDVPQDLESKVVARKQYVTVPKDKLHLLAESFTDAKLAIQEQSANDVRPVEKPVTYLETPSGNESETSRGNQQDEGERPNRDRDVDLQEAANKLAQSWKNDGKKNFSKREIAEALSITDDWKEMKAVRIERILHKQW